MTAGDAPSSADADPRYVETLNRDGGSRALVGNEGQRLTSESSRGPCPTQLGKGWDPQDPPRPRIGKEEFDTIM
eukprot:5520040-Pleurochrysis_carterae.AAC.1